MKRVRVTTGSRLHFGLVRIPPSPNWADDGQRYFGGAGLMIDAPGTSVLVEPATDWSATGPLAGRALAVGRRFAELTIGIGPARIVVERTAPEHSGLGTGTQLELAVATALSRAAGRDDDAVSLALLIGRGKRSAIGVHGFARGGFLVDAGKRSASEIAPLADRVEFPAEWRAVLIADEAAGSWHGQRELDAFAVTPQPAAELASDRLCELIATALTPALRNHDLRTFGTALGEFNALSGELFRRAQGGPFASAEIAARIDGLRNAGVAACGQSSWGPTVFAIVSSDDEADAVCQRIGASQSSRPLVATGRNRGAAIDASVPAPG